MDDFLATSIRYYQLKVKGALPVDPFQETLRSFNLFLDAAVKVDDEYRQSYLETLDVFQQQVDQELREHAAAAFEAVAGLAKDLMPRLQKEDALPRDLLQRLNEIMMMIESRYPGAVVKPDQLPDQLLSAEKGSKLYPGLLKKVEAICTRQLSDFELKEVETYRAWLQKGAKNANFDLRVSELQAKRSSQMENLAKEHQDCLVQSDHLLVRADVSLGSKGVSVACWNTLEFPYAPGLVTDGIHPYCTEILRSLDRKRPEERVLLLEAMTSLSAQHAQLIRRHVEKAIDSVEVVLLQEINEVVSTEVRDACGKRGWTALFSQANQDSSKCDAMTAIISKQPFEETTEVEIVENKKIRHFMAARRAETWFVSCHVPLVTGKKLAPGANEDLAEKVLEQLEGLLREGQVLVAGGDWNADVHEVAARPRKRKSRLYAPETRTCFGNHHTIDGIFCL